MELNWELVIAMVFLILSGFFAIKWVQFKKLVKAFGLALVITANALEDDKLGEEERRQILQSWADVVTRAKVLLAR